MNVDIRTVWSKGTKATVKATVGKGTDGEFSFRMDGEAWDDAELLELLDSATDAVKLTAKKRDGQLASITNSNAMNGQDLAQLLRDMRDGEDSPSPQLPKYMQQLVDSSDAERTAQLGKLKDAQLSKVAAETSLPTSLRDAAKLLLSARSRGNGVPTPSGNGSH